ncbi:hypothetical protein MO973_18050 [Paenibacillus sp. TRM 82003]|nr:hypothetical protein [Paenibacillus sp. TRM 82003]
MTVDRGGGRDASVAQVQALHLLLVRASNPVRGGDHPAPQPVRVGSLP